MFLCRKSKCLRSHFIFGSRMAVLLGARGSIGRRRGHSWVAVVQTSNRKLKGVALQSVFLSVCNFRFLLVEILNDLPDHTDDGKKFSNGTNSAGIATLFTRLVRVLGFFAVERWLCPKSRVASAT